ncbi:MAG: methylase [Gammaproteobacteria bacterium]|nr:methylase [Gammaproteobacteria bacterium]
MNKPFSQACENNKQPILDVIAEYFQAGKRILEIGSGTGQHAVHFCQHLPGIYWIPSEIPENMEIIKAGLAGALPDNIETPITLDVRDQPWPVSELDGLFSANCLHIMDGKFVPDFFRGAGESMRHGAYLCVYGPFKYKGEFTTESNARFDLWLKERDPVSGIRDFESVNELANSNGFSFVRDIGMPANNQMLIWRKD